MVTKRKRDLLAVLMLVALSATTQALGGGGGMVMGDRSTKGKGDGDKDDKNGVYGMDEEGLLTLNAEEDDYGYLFAGAGNITGGSPGRSLFEDDGRIHSDKALLSRSLDSALQAKAELDYEKEATSAIPRGDDEEYEEDEDDKARGKEEEGVESPRAVAIRGDKPRPASAAMLLGSPEDTHKERLRKLRAFLADEAALEQITQRRHRARQQRLWEEEEARKLAAGWEDPNTVVLHDCFMSLLEYHTEAAEAWDILRNREHDPTRHGYEALRKACVLDRAAIVDVMLIHPAVRVSEVPGDLMAECYAAGSYNTMALLVRNGQLPIAAGLFKNICDNPKASALLRVILGDERFQTEGHTRRAMAAATERGDASLVKFLLEEVHAKPSKKALMAAITANQLEIFRLLLAHPGLNPAAFGNAALFEASKLGHAEMTRMLLAHPLVIVKLHENVEASIRTFHTFKHQDITRIWVNEAHIFQPIGWDRIKFPHPQARTLEAASESADDTPSVVILRHLLPALPFMSLSPRLQGIIDCLTPHAPKDALVAFIAERICMHDQPFIRDSLLEALKELKKEAVADGDHPTFVAIRETGLLD